MLKNRIVTTDNSLTNQNNGKNWRDCVVKNVLRISSALMVVLSIVFTGSSTTMAQTTGGQAFLPFISVHSPAPPPDSYAPHRLIVSTQRFSPDTVYLLAETHDAILGESLPEIGSQIWSFSPETDVAAKRETLLTDPDIEHVEFDYWVELDQDQIVPNDPLYSQQWALRKLQAVKAWEIAHNGVDVIVAVVDTGIDTRHPDLQGQLTPPSTWYDFGNNDADPTDIQGHGTHVAGIIGAITNNDTGITGLAHNAQLMPVKVFSDGRKGTYQSTIARGILHATAHGADVINLSLGSSESSKLMESVIQYAHESGVVVVAAAGNRNTQRMHYPAAYDNVISVCATQENDTKSGFSNYGTWVDVCAPGSNILSTVPDGYARLNGTSMAAPYVAGLAALLKSQEPEWEPAQIKARILNTADNIDKQNGLYVGSLGTGRINALGAIAESCFESVQGKIAWNYSGSVNWNPSNIQRLCQGNEQSIEPAQCFQQVMHNGVNWGGGTQWYWDSAVDLCEGTFDASATIDCFQSQIQQGRDMRSAIAFCEQR